MAKEHSKHDLFFAKLMEDKEMARELFKAYFPVSVQDFVDLETADLEHLNPKFVDDVLSSYKVCDVLYKVVSKDGVTLLLMHGEHQSYEDETITLRAICYALNAILEYHNNHKDEPLPAILSLVYYNGEKVYPYSMDPLALFSHVPEEIRQHLFKPILVDLTQYTDQDFSSHGNLSPFEILFKHSKDKSTEQKLNILNDALKHVPRIFLVSALQYTLSSIAKNKKEEFVKMISSHVEKEAFVSIADDLRQEGIEVGMQQGKQQSLELVARKSLSKGLDVQTVAEITGLDLTTVKNIKASMH
jgi:predicted transposase/invertase (TIGR01784 family)